MMLIGITLLSFGLWLVLRALSIFAYERFSRYRSHLSAKKRQVLTLSRLLYDSFILQKEAFDAYKALVRVSMEAARPIQNNVSRK